MKLRSPIIIIDDGINNDLYNIGNLKIDIEITNELEIKTNLNHFGQTNYHGTTCAAIIRKYLPDAELGSIKILSNFRGTRYQLVKAIKWCIDNDIKLVNLSLGTIDFKDFKLLDTCMKYAHDKGLIIIAAFNNERIYTCPASFGNVLGVKCDTTGTLKDSEYIYADSSLDGIEIIANANHYIVDTRGIANITPTCSSYAAPVITASVYKLIEKNPCITLDEIKMHLKNNSIISNKTMPDKIDLIKKNKNIQENIDAPLMLIYDFTGYYGLHTVKLFCELFRKDGYYAVSIIDCISKSKKQDGIISLKEYYNTEYLNDIVLKDIYNVFNCDILISSINKANLNKKNYDFGDLAIDIKVLIIKELTVDIEDIIIQNSEREILILSYGKGAQTKTYKNCKIFYNLYELFGYVLEILI